MIVTTVAAQTSSQSLCLPQWRHLPQRSNVRCRPLTVAASTALGGALLTFQLGGAATLYDANDIKLLELLGFYRGDFDPLVKMIV